MYSFYQITQWLSLLVLLAAAVVATCAFVWSKRRVYIIFVLACTGFALAPSTPWIARALNQLQMTEEERAREKAMIEEIIEVNEKYQPIPYANVPYVMNLPFGQAFLLLGLVYLANEERNRLKRTPPT